MLDVFLLFVLSLCVIRGYRAGFFMGIKNIVSVVVGFMGAVWFSQAFSAFLSENTALPDRISAWLTDKFSGLAFQPDFSDGPLAVLPDVLQNQMAHLFPQSAWLTPSTDFIEWLTNLLIGCLSFAILLVVFTLLVRVLAYTLGKTMDATLPSYMLNHTAGAILYGIQFCLLAAAVLYVSRPLLLTGSSVHVPALVSLQAAVENSWVVQLLESILQAFGWM